MIQDLSFPHDIPDIASVNAGINSDDFPTAWGTFDVTSELILSLPEGCHTTTFNISAAYHLTPIRPDQQNSLCIVWEGKVWIDRAVMFGMLSSAGVFGCVVDMLVDIYQVLGFGPLVKWVDDFFRNPTTRPILDQAGVHQPDCWGWCSVEPQEVASFGIGSMLYWFQLASHDQSCVHTTREARTDPNLDPTVALSGFQGISLRRSKFAWEVGAHSRHLLLPPSFPLLDCSFSQSFSFCSGTSLSTPSGPG